jgi:hypothetical protein
VSSLSLPLFDDSWMTSMDVVVHLLRCGLAVVLRCRGLSKVRYGGESLVLHGVWQVLESAKDLFLGVDYDRTTLGRVSSTRISISDSRRREKIINTHKYNTNIH